MVIENKEPKDKDKDGFGYSFVNPKTGKEERFQIDESYSFSVNEEEVYYND